MTEEFQPIEEKKTPPLEGGFEITQDPEIQDSNPKPNEIPAVDNTVVEFSPQEEAFEIGEDQSNPSQLDKDGFGGVLDAKSGGNLSIDIRKVNRQ